ncbi:retron St85 family effector protein [Vagococcus fluvialis]|uniref:retron St85 family effector protein n=1 Tax=Vagococcus fluvialis TaxID=2738 RepID=UPI003D136635
MKEHVVFKKSTQYQIERILNVFDKISDNMINIFLCGGASDKNQTSYRDELNQYFNSQIYSNVRIFYPEDLFVSLLNSDKSQNMLELENFLVANSDIVCIVAESVGSFVELGAFVNSDKTRQKVVALVEE